MDDDRRLTPGLIQDWDATLRAHDIAYAAAYPGPPEPGVVHTVYVPVPKFTDDVIELWRAAAVGAIDDHPAGWREVLSGIAITAQQDPAQLDQLTRRKLATEPIEDLRIDFEDGFRAHTGSVENDRDEDAHAIRAAEVAARLAAPGEGAAAEKGGTARALPRSWGIRIRSLGADTRHRGLRTLDLFLARLLPLTRSVPTGFVVTLPKVTSVDQVRVFCEVLAHLEQAHQLESGALQFEIQVETPQTLIGVDGRIPLAAMVHEAGGRVSGLHFGTYDYTASLGILGAYQDLRHPVADMAKGLMLLAAAETGVRVSDGSDNRVPVGDAETVRARWATHAEGVTRALRSGIYQGWDLHPAQLPTRFAATFAFYRQGFSDAAQRLADFHHRTVRGVLDEPATVFALARHLQAARRCGAITEDDLAPASGHGAALGLDGDVIDRYVSRAGREK